MKNTKYCVILISVPNAKEGKRLAEGLIEKKIAACVNIIPRIESLYWWQGKMEISQEDLLIVKTLETKTKKVQAWIKKHHSYSTPEVIALPILSGSKSYLNWIKKTLS